MLQTKEDIITFLEAEAKDYENRAEEYFQEIGDEEKGNEMLAIADAIRKISKKISDA